MRAGISRHGCGIWIAALVALISQPAGAKPIEVMADGAQLRIQTSRMALVFDTDKGTVGQWVVDGKALVRDNEQPLLRAVVMQSRRYDGLSDFVPDRQLIEASYRPGTWTHESDDRGVRISGQGELTFGQGDAIRVAITLSITSAPLSPACSLNHPSVPVVTAAVAFQPQGAFKDRYLYELALQLPLGLDYRKRVAQGGDLGFRWDTRYFYQFHQAMGGTLMWEPDRNEWRHFAVEQESPCSFRLWRSESEQTSPLIMQRGVAAAGWISVYDQQGGVLVGLREMAQRGPASLHVAAAQHGRVDVMFQPPTQRAVWPHDPEAQQRLFSRAYQVDWIGFAGAYGQADPEAVLAACWGATRLPSDPPLRPSEHPIWQTDRMWQTPAIAASAVQQAAQPQGAMVTGGMPLPRGHVMDPAHVRVFGPQGLERPVQAQALGWWPDGSVKWVLLTFPLNPIAESAMQAGSGAGQRQGFDVSLRDESRRRFELMFGPQVRHARSRQTLDIQQSGDTIVLDTGPLRLTLGTGSQWLREVVAHGRTRVAPDPGHVSARVDFLRTQDHYSVMTRHPQGRPDPGPVVIERMTVEHAGPMRAVVRLEGHAQSQQPTQVILRVIAQAGLPSVQIEHTAVFHQTDPREAFVTDMGLGVAVQLDQADRRITLGGQDGPLAVMGDAADAAGMEQTGHLHYRAWAQETVAGVSELEHRHFSRGWIDLRDRHGGVMVVLRNMWQMGPKHLNASMRTGHIDVGLWPGSEAVMDVRRYSNYPHRSQGESVAEDNANWVARTFYQDRDPFRGIAISHQMLWHFHENDPAEQLDGLAADFQSRPLIHAGDAWYRHTQVMLPTFDPAAFPRVTRNLDHVLDFWMFNQRLFGWYGMWYYGDFQHHFNRGYGWILPPQELAQLLARPERQRAPGPDGRAKQIRVNGQTDYFPQHNWAFDNGRWGWANTEGLAGFFLQREYLRTGRRDVFFAAEAMAHHARDVVTRHAGRHHGAGTRHGVQPWSDGNHQSRQTQFSEYRHHYLLTGDPRSRHVMQRLVHDHYLVGRAIQHNDHGARFFGLLTWWELTNDPRVGQIVERYAKAFVVPEGFSIQPRISLPDIEPIGSPQLINNTSMMFHNFGGMHAVLEYYYLTGDEPIRSALVKMAESFISNPSIADNWKRGSHLQPRIIKTIAFAARHAPNPQPYRDWLHEAMTGRGWQQFYQMVSSDAQHWAGPTAFTAASIPSIKFLLNAIPYTMTALDREPELSAAKLSRMQQLNEQGGSRLTESHLQESWQSEYDDPVFDEYLGKWRPWHR